MRKLCFVLITLLLTAPAFADMTISCAQVSDTNEVEISYAMDGGDANLPRGFGLDISVTAGTIVDISYTDPCFWIYPGTIEISDGNVTSLGNPVAPTGDPGAQGPLGTSAITVEMGSLYHPDDVNHATAPASSGVLLTIVVSAECNVVVSGNGARGNVVLETTAEATVDYGTGCTVTLAPPDCLVNDASLEYTDWVAWGKPDCWCYQRQCRGDATGTKLGFWVQAADLTILKAAWYKSDLALAGVANGICADFNHAKLGFRVQAADLTILKAYWYKSDVLTPVCDQAPIITGPYNSWTN